MLNAFTKPDASGVWWLYWTTDPAALLYDIILPNGAHIQAGKSASSSKLGGKPASQPKIAAVYAPAASSYETAVDASLPTATVNSTIKNGDVLSSPLEWSATVTGTSPTSVKFYIDGVLKWTESLSPYVFNGDGNKLDPSTLSNGSHTFLVQATLPNGTNVSVSSLATVNVTSPTPTPTPTTGWPYVHAFGISDGGKDDQHTFDLVKQIGSQVSLRMDCYAVGGYAQGFYDCISQGIPIFGTMYGTLKYTLAQNPDSTGNPAGWPQRGTPQWAGSVANLFKGKVPVWEVMNEPDGQGWTPATYAPFFADAAIAIRQGDPAAKIATGGVYKATSGLSLPEFTRAICAELKKRNRSDLMDYFSVHSHDPIDWNSPNSQWHMTFPYGDRAKGDTVREILDANGFSQVPIISTECGANGSDDTWQKNQITAKLAQVDPSRVHDRYFAMFTYRINVTDGQFVPYGLTRQDGSHRPSWGVFQQTVS